MRSFSVMLPELNMVLVTSKQYLKYYRAGIVTSKQYLKYYRAGLVISKQYLKYYTSYIRTPATQLLENYSMILC